jgi:hypothetical protein
MTAIPVAYLTLSATALDRILAEAATAGVDPLWLLAALAAEVQDPADGVTD